MKRVLFVDDDRSLLAGLRLRMQPYREEWHMDFAESGERALELMAAEPYDAIVTDMRMPGMDGAQLLTLVKERYPRTVRIVLTGEADLEAALRGAALSHQRFTKPCDPGALRDVVERACNLERILSDGELAAALHDLPVLPWTYQALTVALGDPDVSLERLASIVEQDHAVTAKVLQLANSSFFGAREEITNVRQATVNLGSQAILDLVLSCGVFEVFGSGPGPAGLSLEGEQRHALLVGRIARRLVTEERAAEDAFLTGMLHDVGRLVLATRLPERFDLVHRAAPRSNLPRHALELRVLGVTHADVGAYLLGLWGMPYQVVDAVARHHSLDGPRSASGLLTAVHVADDLAREAEADRRRIAGNEPLERQVPLDEQVLRRPPPADQGAA